MRFSGHESFPCRYAWLPKAFQLLNAPDTEPTFLRDDDLAMQRLGLGKNMVKSLRFWIQATGVAEHTLDRGYSLTRFGQDLLGRYDPFLEDRRSLWLLHWKLATNPDPIFAWYYLLNQWQHPELTRSEVVRAFEREAAKESRRLAQATLAQHFDVFIHTYVPTRGAKGAVLEDNLDSPFIELDLVQAVGERRIEGSGKREPLFAFRREPKPDITPQLFVWCLVQIVAGRADTERTLSFREIAIAAGSPGQVFKLPEEDLFERLQTIEQDSLGIFAYRDSAALPHVVINGWEGRDLVAEIYAPQG
jgi:hypothetical protein